MSAETAVLLEYLAEIKGLTAQNETLEIRLKSSQNALAISNAKVVMLETELMLLTARHDGEESDD